MPSSFVDCDLKFIKNIELKNIEMRSTSETNCLSLGVSIDGTNNSKGIAMSIACQSLFEGRFPNLFVSIDALDEHKIKKIICNEDKDDKDKGRAAKWLIVMTY